MKKLFLLLILISGAVSAQGKFHPGLRAGANFSKFTGNGYYYYGYDGYEPMYDNMQFRTDFYVGFQFNLRFTKRYALQPELTYSRQGGKATVINYDYDTGNEYRTDEELKVGYVSLAVVNKIYIVDQFHFLAGPTFDIMTENSRNLEVDIPIDMGITAGFGSDITKNFGIEARVKKGIIPVIDNAYSNTTNLVFSVGATFSFF